MNKHLLLAPLLAMAVTTSALAQATVKDPTKVDGGTYTIEPYHTRVMFGISHMGFTTYYGQFTGASGTLKLEPGKVSASSFDITVPSTTISTTNAKLDGELNSADWLDTGKYPTITFKSVKVANVGHGIGKVTGDLTLHGVTKPVTLTAKFNGGGANPMDKKYSIGFDLTGTIKRSDFGVSKYVPMVGDDVNLIISAGFERQG